MSAEPLTLADIGKAKLRAEQLGDKWLASVVRQMANELRVLREQHASAAFVQGLEEQY